MADDTIGALSSYRDSWRAACAAANPVDLEPLFEDAESLSSDLILSRVLDVLARFQPKGSPWPLPGVRRRGPSEFVADWSAFAEMASERGKVEDQRFWRAASVAADADGDPVWLGPVPSGRSDPCVRLGEVPWAEVSAAIGQMETSGTGRYAGHGRRLRDRFLKTLEALRSGPACGCVNGDASAGLERLAVAYEREKGRADSRALAKAARDALEGVKSRRVSWLRESSGAPPTGCGK